MKKQRNFILAIVSMLLVTIALLAFTTSNVSNDELAEKSELVIEKGAKADFDATASYEGCGDGKCGDDKKKKKEGKHDKKKKKDKCGEGKEDKSEDAEAEKEEAAPAPEAEEE